MMPSLSRAFREGPGHEMASLDGAMHLEPIVRLPSCCSPPKFGGHHDTCEDQFGERGGHHHHQLGGFGSRKSKHAPAGTVGEVGASSLIDEYKIQDGVASKDLHAGDEVDFTAAQIGGVLTITKIQKK